MSSFCMLAPTNSPDLGKLVWHKLAQPKLDGIRCITVNGNLRSRTDKPFRSKQLNKIFEGLDLTYIVDSELWSPTLNRQHLISVITDEDSIVPEDLCLYAWDILTWKEWIKKKSSTPYDERWARLSEMELHPRIQVIPHTEVVNSIAEAKDYYQAALQMNYEGAMLKNPKGLYKWGRCTEREDNIWKLKPWHTLDLQVVDLVEGEPFEADGVTPSKVAGILGKLVVDYKGIRVGVGTGFDQATRKRIWRQRKKWLGKIIEVKYTIITPDGSLQNPVFVGERIDKEEADK